MTSETPPPHGNLIGEWWKEAFPSLLLLDRNLRDFLKSLHIEIIGVKRALSADHTLNMKETTVKVFPLLAPLAKLFNPLDLEPSEKFQNEKQAVPV